MKDLDIRYTRILDITYLRRWLQDPEVLKWFPITTPEEIEQALTCWMGFCRYNASLTAVNGKEPCGIATLFLPPYKKVAHQCLFKICVDPEYQRQGVGSALVKNIKHLAKTQFYFEAVYAEVFTGNPLIELLKKFDFVELARQEHYFKSQNQYWGRVLLQAELDPVKEV